MNQDLCYSAIDLVGTKDLKKGLAGRASKSKSKSSKNGLKSGLESKSGLEYYKSGPFSYALLFDYFGGLFYAQRVNM